MPNNAHTDNPSSYEPDERRWEPFLPPRSYGKSEDLNAVMRNVEEEYCIAVVCDVRNSQHLMMYSPSDVYLERMTQYAKFLFDPILQAGGIFDKYTGDGILGYFSPITSAEYMCFPHNYILDFIDFCLYINEISSEELKKWIPDLSRVPKQIGLGIGADMGYIKFNIYERTQDGLGFLIAMGDSIIWATRLADMAAPGKILVNNRLYHKLKILPGNCISLQEQLIETREGEMKAWAVEIHKHKLIECRILANIPQNEVNFADFARAVCKWRRKDADDVRKYDDNEFMKAVKDVRDQGLIEFRYEDPAQSGQHVLIEEIAGGLWSDYWIKVTEEGSAAEREFMQQLQRIS